MFSLSNFLSLFRNEILVATITVFLASHTSIQAQNENNPWQFFFGINAVDTFPTGAAGSRALFEEFINLEHWNISPSRISAKGYGETRPADTNEKAAGRRKNRRVEFNIQK